jgi:nucleoside-diphosphate-sugar epimerase
MLISFNKKIHVLVTGASGFIGRHLCHYLVELGYSVRGTHRGVKIPCGYNKNIEWINVGEIGPETQWETALNGIDYVIHLAALAHQIGEKGNGRINEFFQVNTYGTENLIYQIKKNKAIKRIVYLSSVSVYDPERNEYLNELSLCNPVTDYGRSKLAAEKVIKDTLTNYGTDWCILRPALVYGSGNPGNMARLQRLVDLGLPLPFANIKNKRSFIFVGNLVNAITACINNSNAGCKTFIISDGCDLSTTELVQKIALITGKRALLFQVPLSLLKLIGRVGDNINRVLHRSFGIDTYSVDRLVGSFTIDASFIRNTLNWKAPFSIDEGLKKTLTPSDYNN